MTRRRKYELDPTQVTLTEAAEVLGVDAIALAYLAYRGAQMKSVREPKVVLSREYGQRIEYFLSDLEAAVVRDAEYRLEGEPSEEPEEVL